MQLVLLLYFICLEWESASILMVNVGIKFKTGYAYHESGIVVQVQDAGDWKMRLAIEALVDVAPRYFCLHFVPVMNMTMGEV